MSNNCKYQKLRKYISYDMGATWNAIEPAEYQKGELIEYQSKDCGIIPPKPFIYRWVDTTGYICSGYDKYNRQKKQYSDDSGLSWQDVSPEQYRMGSTLLEANSEDCGYVPPTPPPNLKVTTYYNDGESCSVMCDANTILKKDDVLCKVGGNPLHVEIGDCVTAISASTFYNCDTITSVTIGNNVETIGGNAFHYCKSLKSISIPNSVTDIGNAAFCACWSLTSCTIGNGVTSIGSAVFQDCDGLTSITIPDSVTTLGEDIFQICDNLTSVTIGNSVTSIPHRAFSGTTVFKKMNSDTDGVVNIPDSVTLIGQYAFNNKSGITTVNVGSGVTQIYDGAFSGCSNITSVTFNSNVLQIGASVFRSCTALTSINIPDSVTKIGSWAFTGCKSLTSINIPSGITTIYSYTFSNCSGLTSVDIPDNVTDIASAAFINCSGLTSVTVGSGVTEIGQNVFNNCRRLQSFTIHATTPPTLGYQAFYGTNNNLVIYVPSGSVGSYKSAWSSYSSRIVAIP